MRDRPVAVLQRGRPQNAPYLERLDIRAKLDEFQAHFEEAEFEADRIKTEQAVVQLMSAIARD